MFGILPLLIEAVKAYGTVADGLRTFKHYSREVKSISQRVDTQNGIFHNHCKLLLLLVEDKKAAEGMFEDPDDLRWRSKDLNDKLNAILEDSLEHCRKIIEETKDVLDEVREEMGSFDVLLASKTKVCADVPEHKHHTNLSRRTQDESIKKAIKRLKGAIKITFNKSNYEQCLTRLREQNNDLGLLQSQISAFQKHFTSTPRSLVHPKALPDRFRSIQNVSQKLHEALCSAWCCDDAEHRGHYAKLCLDAEVQTEVRLDLAISCHETSDGTNNEYDFKLGGKYLTCADNRQRASNMALRSVDEFDCTTTSVDALTNLARYQCHNFSQHADECVAKSTEEESLLGSGAGW